MLLYYIKALTDHKTSVCRRHLSLDVRELDNFLLVAIHLNQAPLPPTGSQYKIQPVTAADSAQQSQTAHFRAKDSKSHFYSLSKVNTSFFTEQTNQLLSELFRKPPEDNLSFYSQPISR